MKEVKGGVGNPRNCASIRRAASITIAPEIPVGADLNRMSICSRMSGVKAELGVWRLVDDAESRTVLAA